MADQKLNVTFQIVNNKVNEGKPELTATNIIISIPTPAGLEFDTVLSGSGYSDTSKEWVIGNIGIDETRTLILRYIVTSTSDLIFNTVVKSNQNNLGTRKVQHIIDQD